MPANLRFIDDESARRVALIYQRLAPPAIDGARKDPKPGGYSDSGADIAYCLRERGVEIVTPVSNPDLTADYDWVFPDTTEGLQQASRMGATVIWANTVLFSGHPLVSSLGDFWVVGQLPERQQQVDDKYSTNAALLASGLPVASSMVVSRKAEGSVPGLSDLTEYALAKRGLEFPMVVKPVRGRGSQGVSLVRNYTGLIASLTSLFDIDAFGSLAMVEEYLPGEELTLTVLRDNGVRDAEGSRERAKALVLPPVRRFNHVEGVAPYNGTVAVTSNSVALNRHERWTPKVRALMEACAETFERIGALAPIRIDCRADPRGDYKIFDVNMKPNMTGSGRPGREDQDSLTVMAAHAIGWTYGDLLNTMLDAAWRLER